MDSSKATELPGVFDRAAPTYDQTGVEFFAPLGDRLVAGAGLRSGQCVLDAGCGRGACTFPAAAAVGEAGAVVAIDQSTAMVAATADEARKRAVPQVTVREADAGNPDFPPASFDAVLAGLVVFMLPDPQAALRAYARLLRPGGHLAMSSFGVDDPLFFRVIDVMRPFVAGPVPSVPGRGGPFARRETIAEMVGAAGFGAVRVEDTFLDLEFADRDQWWAWLWQTAGRVALERIPQDRLPTAQERAYEQMESVRRERGRLMVSWNVWLTYARLAAAAG